MLMLSVVITTGSSGDDLTVANTLVRHKLTKSSL